MTSSTIRLQEMSQRADASQCGGVVVEFESDNIRDARTKKDTSIPGKLQIQRELVQCLCSLWNIRLFDSRSFPCKVQLSSTSGVPSSSSMSVEHYQCG